MNAWLRSLDAAPLLVVGWSALIALWYTAGAAVLLRAWTIVRPRSDARTHYRAAVSALAAAAILSLLSPFLIAARARADVPAGERGGPNRPAVNAAAAGGVLAPRRAIAGLPAAVALRERTTMRGTLAPPSWTIGVVGLTWLLGAGICLLRLAGGWLVARRVRQRALPITEGAVLDTLQAVRDRTGAPAVLLAASRDIEAPVVVGATRPAILVPPQLLDALPPGSLTAVFAHELAHVRRRDFAVNLGQSVADALLFHSPAAWWISRRIREVREFCCDDIAARVAVTPATYVEALTLLARLGTTPGPGPLPGAAGPRLITRVRRLLQGEPHMAWRPLRLSFATLAAIVLGSTLPLPWQSAAGQVSMRLLAAQGTLASVPIGYPLRQDGSSVQLRRVQGSAHHVCSTATLHNTADVAVTRVRMAAILSFSSGADRPVQIVRSDWMDVHVPPGGDLVIRPNLVETATARQAAQGGHVQALCALTDVAYANRAAWSVTPNPAATTADAAMGQSRPTLPRAFVGLTSARATTDLTLCLDESASEYSPGAQIAIRDEPGRAARCTRAGAWEEVEPRSGTPVGAERERAAPSLEYELRIAGASPVPTVTTRLGELARLQIGNGITWGFVTMAAADGTLHLQLYDLSATPHRLVGQQRVDEGAGVEFVKGESVLTIRLLSTRM